MLFCQIQTGSWNKCTFSKELRADKKNTAKLQGINHILTLRSQEQIPPKTQSREELSHLWVKWHWLLSKTAAGIPQLLLWSSMDSPTFFQASRNRKPSLPGQASPASLAAKNGNIIWVGLICNQIPVDFSGNYHSNPPRISRLQKRFKSTKLECLNPTDLSRSWEQIQGESAEPLTCVVSCPAQPISSVLDSSLQLGW